MADAPVVVRLIEDDSVQKKIDKTALSLQKKYKKKRKVNERFLKQKTPLQKTFSIIFDVICYVLVAVSALVCISTLNGRIQKTVPSLFGYSNLTISSGSMVESGFEVGDIAVVRKVDTNTLKSGDIIAFYTYNEVNSQFDINSCERVFDETISDKKWAFSFSSIFGIQSSEIKSAAQNNISVVFHEIQEVYTDNSGHRWFVTKGSSNEDNDINTFGYIKDSLVVGAYTNGGFTGFWSAVLKGVSSFWGIFIILIPVILLALILTYECIKNVQKAKLEYDCVEEKRRITDPICVKNNIGFGMDKKTKYKILAQASEEERAEYVALLWKDGSAPNSIKKYVAKKPILLRGNRELLELNRKCEEMLANGEKPEKIAEHYLSEKEKIEAEQEKYQKLLKSIHKSHADNK